MAYPFEGLFGQVGGGTGFGGLLDPRSQAMLGAAQALTQAGGPTRMPVSTGAAMANAMANATANYRQAQAAGMQQQMHKMKFDAAKRAQAAAALQTKYRQELADAYAKGDPALIRAATARAYPEKAAAQVLAKPTYKERNYPLKGGMVQKQISQDGGRTWTDSGDPYDRRNPYMQTQRWNPDTNQMEFGVVDTRTLGSQGQPQGQPQGQTQKKDPTFIPLGQKPPMRATGEESKAIGFADRMTASNTILDQVDVLGADLWQNLASDVPFIGNALVSSDRQRYEQAKRDFINAQLRKESGAAISPSELENANRQYFPQSWDEAPVIEQKRQARNNAVKAMKAAAGVTYTPTSPLPAGIPKGAVLQTGKGPNGGAVYKFVDPKTRKTRFFEVGGK